jgi:hypothetical protein
VTRVRLHDALGPRARPRQRRLLVAAGYVVGALLFVQTPWRPALGLLGLFIAATVGVAADAWGVRGRLTVLRSGFAMPALAAWGGIGLVLLVAASTPLLAQRPAASMTQATQRSPAPRSPAAPAGAPAVAVPPDVTPSASPSPSPSASPSPSPSTRTTPSAPPASFRFSNAPLSGHQGQRVMLVGFTSPGTTCTIAIAYSGAPDLGPDTADSGGRVSWSWRIAGAAPTGTWPITVSCGTVSATTQITVS